MGWENQTAWAMGVLQDPQAEGLSGVAWNLTSCLPWIQLPIPVLVTVSPLPLAHGVCQAGSGTVRASGVVDGARHRVPPIM